MAHFEKKCSIGANVETKFNALWKKKSKFVDIWNINVIWRKKTSVWSRKFILLYAITDSIKIVWFNAWDIF